MSQNYLNLLINELEDRWDEVTILLEEAEKNQNVNVKLHDAICRSVSVLMVSNLEGFYKDLIKSFINDINDNNTFDQLPEVIKRSYCSNFLDPQSKSNAANQITKKLINEFERLNANIDYKPFLFDKNKNPNPKTIEIIFNNLGLKKVFKNLESSRYEIIFSEENSYLEREIPKYIGELNTFTQSFPYEWAGSCFKLQPMNQNNNKTLWEEFLDEVNRRRHEIAHGNDSSNIDSVQTLKKTKNKLFCLQIALIHILIEKFGYEKINNY